jgi:excisionase family DNA binding protein
MPAADERLLSLEDVAARLQVSDQSVRRWIKAGKLAAYKPGLEWRIKPSDLEEFLENRSYPKVQAPLPDAEQERPDLDIAALDEALAADLRQQREFRLQELDIKLERAGNDQERRAEAYKNLTNWWLWFTQPVMTLHRFIPEIPGPALLREGDITVERVREFARRDNVSEVQRDAELQALEELLRHEEHTTGA